MAGPAGEGRNQRHPYCRMAGAGAADEQQRPTRANLVGRVAGDLQRQQDVGLQVATCGVEVKLRQRSVVGTGARDQNVVDRPGQLVEELPEALEIGGVKGGDAGPELEADALQPIWIARGEDHIGSLGAGAPGRLEPHAGATADDNDGLPKEFRFTVDGRGDSDGAHDSSDQRSNITVALRTAASS